MAQLVKNPPSIWETWVEKIGGEKVEEAVVESIAYDKNGKQLGTPHPHRLRRKGGGRWYVLDYQLRF